MDKVENKGNGAAGNTIKVRVKKYLMLLFGIFLFSLGIAFSIRANIGMSPWDTFNYGMANLFGIRIGIIMVIFGAFFVVLNIFWLKEKVGIGTLAHMALTGIFLDFIFWLDIIPVATGLWGYVFLPIGMIILCIGTVFYVGAGLGAGPSDILFIGLMNKYKLSVRVSKTIVEATVFVIGILAGSPIGPGTIITILGVGPLSQFIFKLFKFDIQNVEHESLKDTFKKKA